MRKFVLLIWEIVPESTELYLIPLEVLSEKQTSYLDQAHGKLINADENNDGLDYLNMALADKNTKDGYKQDTPFLDDIGQLREFKVFAMGDSDEILSADFSKNSFVHKVILSGFIL